MTEPRTSDTQMPPRCETGEGKPRRIGVEIELAGLGGEELASTVAEIFGGEVKPSTRFELEVCDSRVGDFKIELDSDQLKKIERNAAERREPAEDGDNWRSELENFSSDLLTMAAEQLVPWEIVSPPTEISDLSLFDPLVKLLRERDAKGTRYATRFAFGVHLNPELPALDSRTILRYLQAFMCLYDWLADREKIDLSRRLTNYIDHFKRDYISLVIDPDYQPDLQTLINDYLEYNPTRNRSLDMLPLFAFLDEDLVRSQVDDERIKKRPTLHYRLPNCDIDNPDWNINFTWENWLQVERLAYDDALLNELCVDFQADQKRLAGYIDNAWLDHLKQRIKPQTRSAKN